MRLETSEISEIVKKMDALDLELQASGKPDDIYVYIDFENQTSRIITKEEYEKTINK